MSDCAIRIPHRTRDESIAMTAAHCRHLNDGGVMRELVLSAATSRGLRVAGPGPSAPSSLVSEHARRAREPLSVEFLQR